MDRKNTLFEILLTRRQGTTTYYKYLSTAREYYPGEQLYMREVHVLQEIGPEGLDNISVLSERLKITPGAVSQHLSKLEKKGFITRIQGKGDKRQFSVVLTEKGRKLYQLHEEYDKENYKEACRLFEEFTEEELETALRFEKQFSKFVEMMKGR